MEDVILINGWQYFKNGDSANLLRRWMLRPFMREFATPNIKLLNIEMSSIRIIVEQKYRDFKQFWKLQDYERNLKVD